MTKINLFMNFLFVLIAIILCAISQCSSTLSNKRLCYDPACSVPISLARTSIKYVPNAPGLLPFDVNVEVEVYSKDTGSRNDLWGVKINGKRGYAPKLFLKEYKVLKKDLKYEVPINDSPSKSNVSNEKHQPKDDNNLKIINNDDPTNAELHSPDLKSTEKQLPDGLIDGTPPYEIIDGTTVHLDPVEGVQPTFVTESVKPTAVQEKLDVTNIETGIDHSPEKVDSTIFTKDDKLLEETIDVNKEHKNQNISHSIDLKNYVTSSEEVTDFPGLTGIDVPLASINVNHVHSEVDKAEPKIIIDENKESMKSNFHTILTDESNVKDAQSSEKSIDDSNTKDALPSEKNTNESSVKAAQSSEKSTNISSTESSMSDQPNKSSEEEINRADVDSNIESISHTKIDKQTVDGESSKTVTNVEENTPTTIVESTGESNIKNIQDSKENVSIEAVTNDKETVPTTIVESTGESNIKNIQNSKENVSIEAVTNDKETVPTTIEESTDESNIKNIQDSKENASKLKTDKNELEQVEVPKTVTIEINNHDFSSPLAKSELEETTAKEEIVSESPVINKILNNDLTEKDEVFHDLQNTTLVEPVSIDALEKEEVNSVSDTTTVSSVSNDNMNLTNSDTVTNSSHNEIIKEELVEQLGQGVQQETEDHAPKEILNNANNLIVTDDTAEKNTSDVAETKEAIVNINVNSNNDLVYDSSSTEVPIQLDEISKQDSEKPDVHSPQHFIYSSHKSLISENILNTNEFRNRNLLNIENSEQPKIEDAVIKNEDNDAKEESLPVHEGDIDSKDTVLHEDLSIDDSVVTTEVTLDSIVHEVQVAPPDVCSANFDCVNSDNDQADQFLNNEETSQTSESAVMSRISGEHNYLLTLIYLSVTAATILIFSLGYYYIENMRRDGNLIAKINKLEKDLLVSTKECTMLNENLKITKDKLTCIEDESFGSNEMVLSLKADLEASQYVKTELEEQVAMLEKDLESATEAGLELERMLREVLSSNNEVNPLAESVEDLQARLNAQQAVNESLTNVLSLKTQEIETLSADLASSKKKYEELEVELTRVTENLKMETNSKNSIEKAFTDKVQQLEMQIKEISTEKTTLQKEMKGKEVEMKDLVEVINQLNSNNLDLEKLYDVSRIKAEATAVLEERDDLKVRLSEVEGAHNLLEEHMKVVKEELISLSEQCKLAEKEKKDAETRLEVLSNFFKEKEAQRQKEEAVWLQKQGEVVSTVERIQTMQNEIQNYKQQIEMLKHEILDQEREYKSQISLLETKAHEQWVVSRQVERRLEESKAEAGQLRNRLTLIEKNMNDLDPDTKLHRLEANGETATSAPLFMGAETSSSPIMFTGSSGVPPPPPHSYMHSLFPPYLPPPLPSASGLPYEVGQRPPPLGGRLSSPPPMPLHPPPSSRYDNAVSSPPPMSPHMLPHFNHHRSPPPPFGSDHVHPPPPPPGSILPPPPLGTTHPWGEESLPLARTSGFHPHQREQRVRNHKGSLHSSGESLDKTHHSSKV